MASQLLNVTGPVHVCWRTLNVACWLGLGRHMYDTCWQGLIRRLQLLHAHCTRARSAPHFHTSLVRALCAGDAATHFCVACAPPDREYRALIACTERSCMAGAWLVPCAACSGQRGYVASREWARFESQAQSCTAISAWRCRRCKRLSS